MHAAVHHRPYNHPGPHHSACAHHHTSAWLCALPLAGTPSAELVYHAVLRPGKHTLPANTPCHSMHMHWFLLLRLLQSVLHSWNIKLMRPLM